MRFLVLLFLLGYARADPCDPNPCWYGGTCIDDGVGGFTCNCITGTSGFWCQIDYDDCYSGPCQNGATCNNLPGAGGLGVGYTCNCLPGTTGGNCEINPDDCDSNPCENGGVCTDGYDDYTCVCAEGFGGENCTGCEKNKYDSEQFIGTPPTETPSLMTCGVYTAVVCGNWITGSCSGAVPLANATQSECEDLCALQGPGCCLHENGLCSWSSGISYYEAGASFPANASKLDHFLPVYTPWMHALGVVRLGILTSIQTMLLKLHWYPHVLVSYL